MIYGLTLAGVVNILNLTVDIMAVGILAGAVGMGILYGIQKLGLFSASEDLSAQYEDMTPEQDGRFKKAVASLVIVSVLAGLWCSFGKPIENALGRFYVHVIADQAVPFKVM